MRPVPYDYLEMRWEGMSVDKPTLILPDPPKPAPLRDYYTTYARGGQGNAIIASWSTFGNQLGSIEEKLNAWSYQTYEPSLDKVLRRPRTVIRTGRWTTLRRR